MIQGRGLTGNNLGVMLYPTPARRKYNVEQLLHHMCREYARCSRTLQQAPVEHKCIAVGTREIAQSHVELMAMQLERELFPAIRLILYGIQIYKGSNVC